ncbi:HNH endonuclease [Bacillus sonorensis]|uniref:HNH endonuclease n=2 Tax=Bacillus sonorensis TaxID=119858 RepID=UPI002281DD79|nr:HNH endonuclease [Bacillus sonorensis]MCY8271265.1 HNH endonuclease [Bacillus sonorensis]
MKKTRQFLCAVLPLLLLVSFILPEFAKAESPHQEFSTEKSSQITNEDTSLPEDEEYNNYVESTYEDYSDFDESKYYEGWDEYPEYQGELEDNITDEELETVSDDIFNDENNEIIQEEHSPILDGIEENDNIAQPQFAWLIPPAIAIVTRVGGKLFVKQYLKKTTKNIRVKNGKLAKKKHPKTGVKFDAKGFPIFNSKHNYSLPGVLIKSSNKTQFKYANNNLRIAIRAPKYAKRFNSKQRGDIIMGRTPRGYVWHHHQNTGRLQLVNKEIHKKTGHTGGKSIWGKL